MLAENGMWYQSESKLKIPVSSACFVVTAQSKTTIAITTSATTVAQRPSSPPRAVCSPPLAAGT